MATDPRERALAEITETLFSGGYDGTEGQDGSRDTTWTDFGVVCGFATSLSAELGEARRERDDAQARHARLEELLGIAVVSIPQSVWRDIEDRVKDEWAAALSGGVAVETRDDETCPTCGSPVRVHTSAEGTSFYVPVGARREPEEPRECTCPRALNLVSCPVHGRAAVSGEAGNG